MILASVDLREVSKSLWGLYQLFELLIAVIWGQTLPLVGADVMVSLQGDVYLLSDGCSTHCSQGLF